MLTYAQSVFIGILIVAASLTFLLLLEWLWPRDARREHNDIVGWQVSVVGMTYAVVIGFMLYAVWTDFEAARANVDAEANALVNISRLAEGLPQAQRESIQAIARQYADSMVKEEWPAMQRGTISPESQILTGQLWTAIVQPGAENQEYRVALDHVLSELADLTEHRRLRQLESSTGLPAMLWAVLTAGAVITISSCCLFGAKSLTLHMLQVLGLSGLIALSLMAIAQIDRPFQGGVHVSPEAFLRAQEALQPVAR